jgi:hypothetical protein
VRVSAGSRVGKINWETCVAGIAHERTWHQSGVETRQRHCTVVRSAIASESSQVLVTRARILIEWDNGLYSSHEPVFLFFFFFFFFWNKFIVFATRRRETGIQVGYRCTTLSK